jgi:N-acyl-phosphatidylethanolamine-hydrolysing phospholipase D
MRIIKKYIIFICCFFPITILSSCNIFYIAVRNVPVFFTPPKKVYYKIKHPIKKSVRLSTVLLQMDDKVIITDPLLTETTGELARRVVEPGIDIANIPKCNIILLSHPHFDHLNLASLQMLEKKSHGAYLVFPEGLENYLPALNYYYVRMKNDNGYTAEYDYIGEEKTIDSVKITTVYAHHWGGRYGLDGYVWGDRSYTGYIIEYHGMTVYFAGDTGYDPVNFKCIGLLYKIDLALIPIGPCAQCEQRGTP